MARTTRKKKTEEVQELPRDAEPAHLQLHIRFAAEELPRDAEPATETTPEIKAEKPKFPENPGNDKQDAEAWAKATLIDPMPMLPFKSPKPPTPEEVTKEILATHGDINEMGNTQMLRHILYELVWARLWKTPKSK